VLVTGGAGWIGAHLVRQLLEQGASVGTIVRPRADLWRLAPVAAAVQVIPIALEDASGLERELQGLRPELCFHLAWPATPGQYLDSLDNLAALSQSLSLVRTLAAVGCRQFIGVGTCLEYDPQSVVLGEGAPTRPRSLYAATKLALALVLEQLARKGEMRTAWARLFFQYGPMEDQRRLVPSVILALLDRRPAPPVSRNLIRDFLHVSDVVGALSAIAASELEGTVNVGSGQPVRIASVVEQLSNALGRPETVTGPEREGVPDETPFLCANVQRLIATGWRARYTLEAGLRDATRWWQERITKAA
jgi:nucleoside-diphosphate-sugar epimerase